MPVKKENPLKKFVESKVETSLYAFPNLRSETRAKLKGMSEIKESIFAKECVV